MSVQFGNRALLAVALGLGAILPATLADNVAVNVFSAEFTPVEPQEGLLDALFEAGYTLMAFVLAAMLIRYVQFQHAKDLKRRSKQRKECVFNEKVCRLSSATPKATTTQAPAADTGKKRAVISGGNRSLLSECDAVIAAARGDGAEKLSSVLESAFARLAPLEASAAVRIEAQEQFAQAALRCCAGRRLFSEALTIYDQMAAQYDLKGNSVNRSVLLYCALESHNFGRCKSFSAGLLESTMPSGNDFVNMVRYSAATNDVEGFKQIVGSLQERGFELDNISQNRALAACASNKTLFLASILVEEVAFAPQLDLVGYNTFLKCCTQSRDCARCFNFYNKMCNAGLVPSEVTFGILLDACNIATDVDRAKDFFRELRESGLLPNAIHYTSFMKVLAGSGLLDQADELLEEMLRSSAAKPDLITYSTLIRAHADHGDVKGAMRVLERMIGQGARPDKTIFNAVVGACAVSRMDSALVMHVYRRLEQHGMKTNNSSLSVLLRALARSEAWDAALNILAEAPDVWHLQVEARLFAQVAQACHNANGGVHKIYACYSAMIKSAVDAGLPVDMAVSLRLVRLCASTGQESAAGAIHGFLARSGGVVSGRDHELLGGLLPAASSRRSVAAAVTS